MHISLALFVSGIAYCTAVFHQGFIQHLETFGASQQDRSKTSSCIFGSNSPASAAKKYHLADMDRLQAAMQNTRWSREAIFEIPLDERPHPGMESALHSKSPCKFDHHSRGEITTDPSTLRSLSSPRTLALNFGPSRFQDEVSPRRFNSIEQPLLALCFDFDQTLSEAHIHNLKRKSNRGSVDENDGGFVWYTF